MKNTQEYNKNYWLKHREELREKRKKKLKKTHRIKSKYYGLSQTDKTRLMRVEILNHYSKGTMSCACCGERELKFLCIDHINNDGGAHRKTMTKTGRGGNIVPWIFYNGFPDGFQILCYNCNNTKSIYGLCPHQSKK